MESGGGLLINSFDNEGHQGRMDDSDKHQDEEEMIQEPQAEGDCVEDEEEESRGQKRPLHETLSNDETSVEEEEECLNDTLPSGVQAYWNNEKNTAIVEFEEENAESESSSSICLVGRASLKCLEGSVEVLGYDVTADSEEIEITSPFWSSWISIKASNNNNKTKRTKIRLNSIRGDPSFRLVGPTTRPIVIPRSWKTTVEQVIQDWSQQNTFSTRDSLEADSTFRHSKQQLVICGAKGVGKSTLLRYMTNRLLSSSQQLDTIAILDADVGQPECSPPGLLRLSLQRKPLLQPPYWNLCKPIDTIASVFYGAVTSKVDPTRYTEAVKYLIQKYQEFCSSSPTAIPLLVNMDGWVKGIGYQILTALVADIQPSHVCQILGESKAQIFDLSEIVPKEGTKVHFLQACNTVGVVPRHVPSSTMRTLRLATYFASHLVELWDTLDFLAVKQLHLGLEDDKCKLARYLAQERPYCVPFESVRFSLIGTDHQDLVNEDRILEVLNASFVGLNTDENNCLGLGLIRSIDFNRRLFYILTPVDEKELTNATHLVGGNLPLPLSFVFRGVYAESFPYLRFVDTAAVKLPLGSDPMRSRNNIGRRSIANSNP